MSSTVEGNKKDRERQVEESRKGKKKKKKRLKIEKNEISLKKPRRKKIIIIKKRFENSITNFHVRIGRYLYIFIESTRLPLQSKEIRKKERQRQVEESKKGKK